MDIKVSIIVPVYNSEKYINQCVESLLRQTLEEIEIILVDDASTDNSYKILQNYKKIYPEKIVLYHFSENRKQGAARNHALKMAKGEYVLFVDSDDWLEKDACELLYKEALESNSDIVFFDYFQVEDGNVFYQRHVCEQYLGKMTEKKKKALLTTSVVPWAKLIRKKLIINNQLYFPEGYFYEDQATTYLYYLYVEKTTKIKKALYYYRITQGSTTTMKNVNRHFQHMDMAILLVKRVEESGFFDVYKEELEYFVFEQMYIHGILNILKQFTEPQKEYIQSLLNNLLALCPNYEDNVYYRNYVSEKYKRILFLHMRNASEMIKEIDSQQINFFCDNYMMSLENNNEKINKLITYIKENRKRTVLWGAGKYAINLVNYLEYLGHRVDRVVDRDENKHGTKYGSHLISCLEVVKETDFIIVPYSNWVISIKETLEALGIYMKVFNFEVFIKHDLDISIEDYME